jgi:hypothetical protein
MPRRVILLIDDKPYGLRQIEDAIPESVREECELRYLPSMVAYREAKSPRATIALLDFFLEQDRTFGHLVAHEISAEHLVGFSSWPEGSQSIAEAVRTRPGYSGEPEVHAVTKRKDVDGNPELAALFARLLRDSADRGS